MTFHKDKCSEQCVLPKIPELGQVWTPRHIADEMVELASKYFSSRPEIIVDPAVGPGTFVESLHKFGFLNRTTSLQAFDVDDRMVKATRELSEVNGLSCEVTHANYLTYASLKNHADFVIMNPPYIRHEKLSESDKLAYANTIAAHLGERIPKRSNLFAYFLLKGLSDLKYGGVLCAIVYDGLTETKVGQSVLQLIQRNSEILVMKPVKMPFDGAIIDASIVLMRRTPFRIEISEPITTSRTRDGYVQVLDLANVYRGTGLINSKFFLAKPEDPFYGTANVFIKKGARNTGLVIDDDHSERAYLFETVQEVPPNFTGWVLDRAKKSDLKAKTLFDVASICVVQVSS